MKESDSEAEAGDVMGAEPRPWPWSAWEADQAAGGLALPGVGSRLSPSRHYLRRISAEMRPPSSEAGRVGRRRLPSTITACQPSPRCRTQSLRRAGCGDVAGRRCPCRRRGHRRPRRPTEARRLGGRRAGRGHPVLVRLDQALLDGAPVETPSSVSGTRSLRAFPGGRWSAGVTVVLLGRGRGCSALVGSDASGRW